MCSAVTSADPPRSAMVRPTFSTRSYPRALRPSRSIAFRSSARPAGSGRQSVAIALAAQRGVRAQTIGATTRLLRGPRHADALAHGGRGLARRTVRDRAGRNGRDVDDQIEAVAEWSRQATPISRDLRRRAAARTTVVAAKAARTRIHRRHEHEPRRKDRRSRRPRDRDASLFERLPQHFEDAAIELRHLVQEQHAVVRERDLPGAWNRPAADERHVGDGVVWRAERPRGEQARPCGQRSGHRMDRRAFQRFLERERRQNARQPPGQHRLPGAGRAGQEQVVTAGGRDFERTPGKQLPTDVREIAMRRDVRVRWSSDR